MNLKKRSAYIFILPLVFFAVAVPFVSFTEKSYNQAENELVSSECNFISYQIAENLKQLILTRAQVLMSVTSPLAQIFPMQEQRYKDMAATIYADVPGFLAVNWVNPEGFITWVYPDNDINQKAKGKKVLERGDLKKFLEDARRTRQPQLSDIVNLYQGGQGIIFYIPIFDKAGHFFGWFNGVVEYKKLLDHFFEKQKFEDFYIKLTWENSKQSVYEYGPHHTEESEFYTQFGILNQSLRLEANLRDDSLLAKRKNVIRMIFIFSYFVITALTILFFRLLQMYSQLSQKNHELKLDKTIISILSHDMAAPLTLISENALRLKDKIKEKYVEIERIINASEKQKDLLKKVRSLHVTNLGKLKMDFTACHVSDLVREAISIYDEQAKNKKIKFECDIPKDLPDCLTDKTTVIHNVIGNALSNAIKFSDENSVINISACLEKNVVVLKIRDHGRGIPKEILKNIYNEDFRTSTRGTNGELGTGLGIIQMLAFMQYYSGRFEITSDTGGTLVKLLFRPA